MLHGWSKKFLPLKQSVAITFLTMYNIFFVNFVIWERRKTAPERCTLKRYFDQFWGRRNYNFFVNYLIIIYAKGFISFGRARATVWFTKKVVGGCVCKIKTSLSQLICTSVFTARTM